MSDAVKINFSYVKRKLNFRFEAGTSRGVMTFRDVYWIKAQLLGESTTMGWGEASPLPGLSPDFGPDFEKLLQEVLQHAQSQYWPTQVDSLLYVVQKIVPFTLPSLRFGLETAILDAIHAGAKRILPNSFFDQGIPIPINGLIWMGDREFMRQQIDQKLEDGFSCLKMKIGAISFDTELDLLSYIRDTASSRQLTLRVDANGAFSPAEAINKLDRLAPFNLHSIEQPIPVGNWEELRFLCKQTPIPIALDEELIGITEKEVLLDKIQPQFIILKPTLLGGILETKKWIELAEQRGIGWWMTSALESNIGLNAIAQLAATFPLEIPQGLGTGKLFHNNLDSPLLVHSGHLHYQQGITWEEPVDLENR